MFGTYINCRMLWLDAFGLGYYWRKSVYTINEECRMKYNNKGVEAKKANAPLKLKQLYVPFLLLLVGYLLAALQFAREKMHEYLQHTNKVKVDTKNEGSVSNVSNHHPQNESVGGKAKIQTDVAVNVVKD